MGVAGQACALCANDGGFVLWRSRWCRVVRVDDPHYPGFCRVIWNDHVREMSDLPPEFRSKLMRVVITVETVVRRLFNPDKINLASFGNVVPHLHWHIIPRWQDDRHFPEPVWGSVRREGLTQRPVVSDAELAQAVSEALAEIE